MSPMPRMTADELEQSAYQAVTHDVADHGIVFALLAISRRLADLTAWPGDEVEAPTDVEAS
jgi:hypothetical protein